MGIYLEKIKLAVPPPNVVLVINTLPIVPRRQGSHGRGFPVAVLKTDTGMTGNEI